jgi:hypothetical protein
MFWCWRWNPGQEDKMTDMSMKAFLEPYDFNLPLRDALNDPTLSADRRVMAAAAMRQHLDDAYYAAMELLEAFRALRKDIDAGLAPEANSEGEERVRHILAGDGDDYQRRLYYLLSERPVTEAIDDLEWLTRLTWERARMVRTLRDAGARMPFAPGANPKEGYDPIGCRPFGC